MLPDPEFARSTEELDHTEPVPVTKTELFEDPKTFVSASAKIAQFLYSKSTHAKVKEGEMYLAHFSNVPFGTEYVDAIGIFKGANKAH